MIFHLFHVFFPCVFEAKSLASGAKTLPPKAGRSIGSAWGEPAAGAPRRSRHEICFLSDFHSKTCRFCFVLDDNMRI